MAIYDSKSQKILSFGGDKRIQIFDCLKTFTYVKTGGNKSEKQHKTKDNTKLIFSAQEFINKLFYGYTEIASEARYRLIKGE